MVYYIQKTKGDKKMVYMILILGAVVGIGLGFLFKEI